MSFVGILTESLSNWLQRRAMDLKLEVLSSQLIKVMDVRVSACASRMSFTSNVDNMTFSDNLNTIDDNGQDQTLVLASMNFQICGVRSAPGSPRTPTFTSIDKWRKCGSGAISFGTVPLSYSPNAYVSCCSWHDMTTYPGSERETFQCGRVEKTLQQRHVLNLGARNNVQALQVRKVL